MKPGLGILMVVILLGLGIFSSVSQVYSATSTPAVTLPAETETPAPEVTAGPDSGAGYQDIADQLFETLAAEGGEAALTYAFSTNPYASKIEDQLTVMINQYISAEQMMGEYIGYELLLETKVSDRLVVQYYLVLYERQPVKFELVFYNARDEWVFQNFTFEDIIGDVTALTRLSILESDKVIIEPRQPRLEGLAQID